jgi:hypothetical protein
MARTLTTANAVLTIAQAILFPIPQELQGFAADDIFDIDSVRSAETLMGVDGVLSAGFVWAERVMSISLQADSLSNDVFDVIATQMQAAQDVYELTGLAVFPSLSTQFVMTRGFLTGYKPAPDAKRIAQPRRYQITWGRVHPAPA